MIVVKKTSFRCKYKGNETFCSFKIVVCQKGTYLFNSVFNFPTVIRFKLKSSERFKWSEFNISDPDFKFQSHNALSGENVTTRWKKVEIKVTNLRFASLFVTRIIQRPLSAVATVEGLNSLLVKNPSSALWITWPISELLFLECAQLHFR